MPITLDDLARSLGAAAVHHGAAGGDGSLPLSGACTLESASPGDVTLVDAPDKLHLLAKSRAGAAIVPVGTGPLDRPTIESADVHAAFAATIQRFRPPRTRARGASSPQAAIDPSARIGADVEIHPFASVGPDAEIADGCTIHAGAIIGAGCRIGAGTVIFPNAILYDDTRTGARCIVHAGAVLGAHGFGYKSGPQGHVLSAQLGWVELGDDVEIGANTTIDRGTYGPTVIGTGTKVDNLVMIAHNCRIGRHCMICSQVGVAGSTTTGDFVVMAGQVGVRDHVHIGDRAVLGARSGVSNDIPPGVTVLGEPAIELRERKLQLATMTKLPEMRKVLKDLVTRVASLESAAPGEDHSRAA